MTIRETARFLGLKVRTIREWIRTGRIPAEKIGGKWHILYDVIMSEEVQQRADKGREHSRRIKEGRTMGVRKQGGQNPKKPIQRKKRKGE